MSLPSNDTLLAFSGAVPWQQIEPIRRQFQRTLETLTADNSTDQLPLDAFSEAIDAPVSTFYDANDPNTGNTLYTEINGHKLVLGSFVSARYRSGQPLLESIVPYNLNPS